VSDYTQASKLFAQMLEIGIPKSTDYKEVSSIYDQVRLQPNSTISMWSAAADLKI
jgi:hypothetical protein